jgi:hypothetical protein
MGTPFKMKGSPMARNFGIGSPLHDHEKDEDGNVIEHQELLLTHSDTTTAVNPVTPGMISLLSRQGMTKEEINILHKHNEPGQPYGRKGKIKKK